MSFNAANETELHAESVAYLEQKANVRILNYINVTFIVIFIAFILNSLNIFIIDKALMNNALFITIPNTIIPLALCKIFGMQKKWIKYMLLFFSVLEVGLMGSFLTYHTILMSILPILYSTMYGKKSIMYLTFAANIVVSTIAMYVGYFYGLCDANILLLTSGSMELYVINGLPNFTAVNDNPWLTVGLYYGFPRAITLFVLMRICISISRSIRHLSEHSISMRYASEIDSMTGLFNRNKYLSVIGSDELKDKCIAVIFFDINSLKFVNDNYGHEYGDVLIKKIASGVNSILDPESRAFRIGGDEIVVIMDNGSEEKVSNALKQWYARLYIEREITKLPLSVAIGTAIGSGSDIEELVKEADKKMYEDKARQKQAEHIQ